MKIYRINRNEYANVSVCGKSLAELQDYFLPDIIDINSINAIPPQNDFYCVLYEDTPLVTMRFLNLLKNRCNQENRSYAIGDGFITKNGLLQEKATTKSPFARQFKLSAYQFFFDTINRRILKKHSENGVLIFDNRSTFIDVDVIIESGACIRPRVTLSGKCVIGKNTVIGEGSHLNNATVGRDTTILSSYMTDCFVGNNCTVGPFACLRKNARVGDNCRIGDFVEIKNSTLGDGVKAAHLAYIGDSDVGNKTNVGCGTVFANYDGVNKHRCSVGENVFIGANTNLIAPLNIGDDVFIAAGSTVTRDVPDNVFCIARAKQNTKPLRR